MMVRKCAKKREKKYNQTNFRLESNRKQTQEQPDQICLWHNDISVTRAAILISFQLYNLTLHQGIEEKVSNLQIKN